MMMEGTASVEKVGNRKLKLKEEEDRISALPDSLLHLILSFLPSTKEAIRTSVLSRRWKNQWSGVPVLIFDSTGMSDERSFIFIDATLIQYGSSKIRKFHIRLDGYNVDKDPHLYEKIHFAIRRNVEELILEFPHCHIVLPEFLFNHAPLVKLRTLSCTIKPNERINWECLKELNIESCRLPDQAVENILCGSPLLESLELTNCFGFGELVVASKSLKKLELGDLDISVLEISCPNLEEFNLYGLFGDMTTRFMNLSSLICAALNFEYDVECEESLAKEVLEQLQHVKELIFGRELLGVLSCLELGPGLSPLSLRNKSLTLNCPDFGEHCAGIEYALLNSHFLEKLVIIKEFFLEIADDVPFVKYFKEDYWSKNRNVFNCLVSHLKIVEVIGLSKSDDDCTFVLNFIEFLLKNSRVLEKLVVVLKGGGKDFVLEVSLKLLTFPRCSPQAVVELLSSDLHVGNRNKTIDL